MCAQTAPNSALPGILLSGFFEDSQRCGGGRLPGEAFDILVAGGNQPCAQLFIGAQAQHGRSNRVDIVRVYQQRSVAGNFGQGRVVGCQDRDSSLLGFEHG